MDPNFAILALPYSQLQSRACTEGLRELADSLEGQVEVLEAPSMFEELIRAHRVIHLTEAYRAFDRLGFIESPHLSNILTDMLEEGKNFAQDEYEEALDIRMSVESFFQSFFEDFDAILSPSASGEAPLFNEGHTGNPIFCTVWTLAGLPTLNLPIMRGEGGLPMGLQMVGRLRDDARLLRTARWFMTTIFDQGEA
tara:strand:+ start:216 stop:803 length:588 start_codon:yes stop_codon:yes gene_type:complete